jgi:type II secretion system protein G
MFFRNAKVQKGFTLIELLVVIAIIGILSSVVLASLNSARGKARDAKRKQDIVQVRTALEGYFADNGSYPLPGNGQWWGGTSAVSCATVNGTVSGASAYIQGLTPTYIPTLPVDPSPAANCNGYLYHSDGVSYKLLSYQTPESYPSAGGQFYDPQRPTSGWMICGGDPAGCAW